MMTGSVALLSDALESVINVATAIAAIVAIRYAAQPAYDKHHYGHEKAEYLSAAMSTQISPPHKTIHSAIKRIS